MNQLNFIRLLFLSIFTFFLVTRPSHAAREVYLDYGFASRSLPISTLEDYAQSGELDPELRDYISRFSHFSEEQVRHMLNTPLSNLNPNVPLQINDSFVLSQWLYSPIGETALKIVGRLVKTNERNNGWKALRAALILASAEPEGLTLID